MHIAEYTNSHRTMRLLILIFWTTAIASTISHLFPEPSFPETLREYLNREARKEPTSAEILILSLYAFAIWLMFWGSSQLIFLQPNGRRNFTFGFFVSILLTPSLGPLVASGQAALLGGISSAAAGMLIGWLYLSNNRPALAKRTRPKHLAEYKRLQHQAATDYFTSNGLAFPNRNEHGVFFTLKQDGSIGIEKPLAQQSDLSELLPLATEWTGVPPNSNKTLSYGVVEGSLFLSAAIAIRVLTKLNTPSGIMIAAFTILFSVTLGKHISWISELRAQRKRDRVARNIIENLNSKESTREQFTLYLRSFEITSMIPMRNPKATSFPITPDFFAEPKYKDIETFLLERLSQIGWFISLGLPGETNSCAGRTLSSEVTWKDHIEDAINAASLILVVPSRSPGVEWEIDFIRKNQYLSKTIFFIPPSV